MKWFKYYSSIFKKAGLCKTTLAQRRGNDPYMGTTSEKYDECTNVLHTMIYFFNELIKSFYMLYFVRCRIFMSRELTIYLIVWC